MSARRDALQILSVRVSQIRISNGYNTDAGERVFIGETPTLGPSDPLASIAIVVKDDEVIHQGKNVLTAVPVDVQAIVKADAVDPFATIEKIVEDIKRAVEKDHNLGGTLVQRGLQRSSTRPLEREDGSTFVGAAVEYRLAINEGWGSP